MRPVVFVVFALLVLICLTVGVNALWGGGAALVTSVVGMGALSLAFAGCRSGGGSRVRLRRRDD